jgi:hypothetical protein
MVAGLASIAAAPAAAQPDVVTFGYTGEEERFVVPAGVTSIGVVATGAKGQRGQDYLFPGPGGPGGFGARVASELAVTPGQVLYVRVGGPGVAGGFNGGGPGATGNAFLQSFGGNGGGATDLRTCPAAAVVCPDGSTDSLASRVVVAGGGGGGGGGNGGQPQLAGTGGSAQTGSRVGGSGTDSEYVGFGGGGAQGGQVDAPGDGGIGRNGGQPGFPGSGPDGGAGGSGGGNAGHGAGGGGGRFGGGGGGAGFGGGGGGAGSSHGPEGTVYGVDTTGVSSLVIYFSSPQVVTGAADSVAETAANLNGLVNPQAQDTTWRFEYGTDTSYGQVAPVVADSAGAGTEGVPVQATASGLEPGTTYHFRLVATNAVGTTAGIDRTFTTAAADPDLPMLPPAVSTGPATAIGETTAVVAGSVNPRGRETTWVIEYGQTTGDVRSLPVPAADAGAGSDPVAVSVPLAGLTPGTTHWYRVVAANAAGTSEGIFRSFTTRPQSAPVTPPAPAPAADLRLSITSSTARPRVGRALTLRVRVVNGGPGAARDVAATVALPRSLRLISASPGCASRRGVVTCARPGALAAGRQRSFAVGARPATRGRAVVSATVRASTRDPGGARARIALRIAG